MRKLLSLFLFSVFTVLFFNGWSWGGSDKKKVEDVSKVTQSNTIAIGKFQLSGRVSSSQYSDLLADFRTYIDDEFTKNGKFKVIDSSKIDKILNKRILQELLSNASKKDFVSKLEKNKLVKKDSFLSKVNNLFDNKEVRKYKRTNAQYILLGDIKDFKIKEVGNSTITNGTISSNLVLNSYISVALIHVATQEIVAKENIIIEKQIQSQSDQNTQIIRAMSLLSKELVSKLLISMSGKIKVLNLQDNTVVISGGSQNGIKKDMLFDIFSTTNFVDESTKKIYTSQSQVATIKITRVDKDLSFGTLINTIKMPKGGDIVKVSQNIKKKKIVKSKSVVSIGKFRLGGKVSSSQYADLLSGLDGYIGDVFTRDSDFQVIDKKNAKRGYIVSGEIRDFNLDVARGSSISQSGVVSTISKKKMRVSAYISISMKDIVTQKIITKENFEIDRYILDDGSADTTIRKALQIISEEITSKLLLSTTKNIKVILSEDGEVTLNKGLSSGIRIGALVDIYSIRNVVDGEQIHKIEKLAATAKVYKSKKEMSIAKLQTVKQEPKAGNIVTVTGYGSSVNSSKNRTGNTNNKAFVSEKIRIAISKTVINDNNFVLNRQLATSINNTLNHKFSNSNMFVVDNKDMDDTLAQQLFDALNKGREAGLPIGSIRGIDYLLSINVDYVQFNDRKVDSKYLKLLDMKINNVKKANVSMHGNVYLINVQTNNRIVDAKITVKHTFRKDVSEGEMRVILSDKFATQAAKIIFNKLTPPRIIQNNGNSVMLDSGKDRGFQIGDILDVYSKSSNMVDDRTGQTIAVGGMPVGKIKVHSFNNRGQVIATIIEGNFRGTGLEVKLSQNNHKPMQNNYSNNNYNNNVNNNQQQRAKNRKKYMALKPMIFASTISNYKKKLIKKVDTSSAITESAMKTKNYRILSREADMLKQQIEERQFNESSLTAEQEEGRDLFSKASYILIPKVTEFSLYTNSKKMKYITTHENNDYVYIKISITLMNMHGEILGISSATNKYSHSWASEKKMKRGIPTQGKIKKTVNRALDKCLTKIINQIK